MSKTIITSRTTDFDEGFDVEPVDLEMEERGDRLSPVTLADYDEQVEGFEDPDRLTTDNDDELDWMERYDNTGYVGWSRFARQT